jgi:hypothetical protein
MEAPADVFPWTLRRGELHVRSSSVALDPEAYLKLFSQMELKITIAWSARPRQENTLRGGLRVYDAGRAEAPLVSPRALLNLLGGSATQTLRITRSEEHGGGTIDVARDRDLAGGIRFLEGDVMTVGMIDPEEANKIRKKHS